MTDRTPTSDPVAAAWEGLHDEPDILAAGERGYRVHKAIREHRPIIEEAIRQQAHAAFAAQVAGLRDGVGWIVSELDEQDRLQKWDPAVRMRNAVLALLAASPEPEAPGSGLREAAEDDRDRAAESNWAALAAARPDGAEADAS